MKRTISIAIIGLSLLQGMTAFAATDSMQSGQNGIIQTATVNTWALYVRSNPAMGENIIGAVKNGDTVTVVGKQGIWCQIIFAKYLHPFVACRYLTFLSEQPVFQQLNVPPTNVSSQTIADLVYAYNQAVTAADDRMGTVLSTAIDAMGAEMDKAQPDLAVLEKLDRDMSAAIRRGVLSMKVLVVPNGPGVKEFHDALMAYLQETENFSKADTSLIASLKTKNSVNITKASKAYQDQIKKVTDVVAKLDIAQQNMIDKNK